MTSHSTDPFAAIAEMGRETAIKHTEQETMRYAMSALTNDDLTKSERITAALDILAGGVERIERLKGGRPT